jgi:hypothetical protein
VKLLDDTLHFLGSDNPAIDEEAADKGLQHSLSREQDGSLIAADVPAAKSAFAEFLTSPPH